MNGDPRESTVMGMNKRSGDRMNKKLSMHVVSMGHGYERQSRERKGGEGIMSKKCGVGYMVYGLDRHEVWQPNRFNIPNSSSLVHVFQFLWAFLAFPHSDSPESPSSGNGVTHLSCSRSAKCFNDRNRFSKVRGYYNDMIRFISLFLNQFPEHFHLISSYGTT